MPGDGKKKNITGDKINNIFKKYVKKNKIKLTKRNGGNKRKNIKKRSFFFFANSMADLPLYSHPIIPYWNRLTAKNNKSTLTDNFPSASIAIDASKHSQYSLLHRPH